MARKLVMKAGSQSTAVQEDKKTSDRDGEGRVPRSAKIGNDSFSDKFEHIKGKYIHS